MKELECDILVVGGGVAGLCSAIATARKGLKTILIDKGSEIGLKIKGECIKKESEIFNKIFEKGIPNHVILTNLKRRRIYSPSTKNVIDIDNQVPYISIDYRLFIVEIFKELSKTNCQVMLNTELIEVLKDNLKVIGAQCKQDGEEIIIKSKFLIAADGGTSRVGNQVELFNQKEVYHAYKLNYENLKVPDPERIELYLITDPPGAMWMFPKGKTFGEAGITAWTHDLPRNFDIAQLWRQKSQENLILKEIIKKAKFFYTSRDVLNFGGPVKQIFGDGVAFVGSSGGHVGGIGAAGIISCMTIGFDVAEFIANSLQVEGEITEGMVTEFLKKYKKSAIQKFLKNEKSAGKTLRNILFETFKTPEAIDESWAKLKIMVEKAGFE